MEARVRESEILDDPEHAVAAMEHKVEVHASGVIAIELHKEEHPQESSAFEDVDDVSHGDEFRTNCI